MFYLETQFFAQGATVFTVYHGTVFQAPSSNGSFVTAIKPEAEKYIRTTAMLLLHVLNKYYLD
jgi:hypothetical protein